MGIRIWRSHQSTGLGITKETDKQITLGSTVGKILDGDMSIKTC